MDKIDVVYIHNVTLLSHKKDEILPFVTTWMGLRLNEVSQMKKDKYHMISLIGEICS